MVEQNKKFISADQMLQKFFEEYLKVIQEDEEIVDNAKKHRIYIDTTVLKWGSEYDGEIQKTTHVRVKVDNKVVSYDYKNLKELLNVLKLLSNVEIVYNGETI